MKLIISPAKKMNIDADTAPCQGMPVYLEKAQYLMEYIKTLSYQQCKTLWKCNDKIAKLNYHRFQQMDLAHAQTPALLSYEGIQYQYLAPKVLTKSALAYLQNHLRILSGFYGILRPFDAVTPYRLEMQARFREEKLDSLYMYWGDILAEHLFLEDSLILNLASKEYSKCISPYLKKHLGIRMVTCVFGERIHGKIIEKGTLAKMARGEMVRMLSEHQADNIEEVKTFDRLGYCFCEKDSDKNTLVFIKEKQHDK